MPITAAEPPAASPSPAAVQVRGPLQPVAPFVAIVVLAFLVRLVPVLVRGSLYGSFSYDDGVYFGAALALVHGIVPYRDFLLLHPPGIVYLLAPFAWLGGLVGDDSGFAVARIAFMALGAANTLLVILVASSWGRRTAMAAGILYAVWPSAVMIERSSWLIAPQNTLLLLVLLALLYRRQAAAPGVRRAAVAGILAGLAFAVQIWAVAPMAVVLAWLIVVSWRAGAGWVRPALAFVVAGGAAAGLLWLPFLALSGWPMVRYIVVDQLGRTPEKGSMLVRLALLEGLPAISVRGGLAIKLLLIVAGVAAVGLVGWSARRGRVPWLPLGVLLVQVVILTIVPPFPHYAGWPVPALALVLGSCAAGLLGEGAISGRRAARGAEVVFGVAAVGLCLVSLVRSSGVPLDRAGILGLVGDARCVTTDSPVTLIETGLFERNLTNGCALKVDATGTSYDVGRELKADRRHNTVYQQAMVDYYGGSDAVLLARISQDAWSPAAAASIHAIFPNRVRLGAVTVLTK